MEQNKEHKIYKGKEYDYLLKAFNQAIDELKKLHGDRFYNSITRNIKPILNKL